MNRLSIFHTRIDVVTFSEAVEVLKDFIVQGGGRKVFTPNTEIVMETRKNERLRALINSGDLVVADGIGLVIGSKLKGHPLPERVTGYDMSIELLTMAKEKGYGLFFLGGKPGVAQRAKVAVEKSHPGIRIVGTNDGYFKGTHLGYKDHPEEQEVIQKIKDSKADILFVGLGFPKQEIWIDENVKKTGVALAIGNGGVLDVLAGEAKRAPDFFIRLHLEWFYRLIKNPSRWKRQLAIPKFLYYIIRDSNAVVPWTKGDN